MNTFIKNSEIMPSSFHHLGKSKESKGRTMIKNLLLDTLDVITHNDRYDLFTLIECPLLDDRDAIIDSHMSNIIENFLVIETLIDLKYHCTL